MTQPSDIRYFLQIDDERVAIANHMTLGRHLDNDVLLAGEDVLDYHLRVEMTDRGPRAVPLGEASLRVNGLDLTEAVGLMPGDRLHVGQNEVTLEAEPVGAPEAESWRLHGRGDRTGRPLDGALGVGRSDDNGLVVDNDHVSRRHARLVNHRGLIWLQDLGSSNGTFVNGERLVGACRLFHGDEVRFDSIGYQLIGRGADLTPVVEADVAETPRPLAHGTVRGDRQGGDTTEFAAVSDPPPVSLDIPTSTEAGAFLLGASDPVAGMTFRTPMGRTLIGRRDDCDVVIRDRTVSARHAELMVRAEGVTITNLMTTNGTRVNGEEIQTGRLHDGDVLRFGRVSLVFKDVPRSEADRPWLRRVQYGLMAASLVFAALLVLFAL